MRATDYGQVPLYPMAGLTESLPALMSFVIPWSFEPAGLQPR